MWFVNYNHCSVLHVTATPSLANKFLVEDPASCMALTRSLPFSEHEEVIHATPLALYLLQVPSLIKKKSLKTLLWKLKSWLTTCIYCLITCWEMDPLFHHLDIKYKWSVKISTFISTIYFNGVVNKEGNCSMPTLAYQIKIYVYNLPYWVVFCEYCISMELMSLI